MQTTDFRRRLRRPLITAFCTVAATAAFAPHLHAQDVGLPIGTAAPAAEVEDLDGNTVEITSLIRGRPTLIEFWATWCPLCAALEPRLQAAKKEFGEGVDFIIIGVAVNETPRRIRRHLEDHTPTGPVFFDRRGAAVRAYRAPTTSYVVILDTDGKVAYTGTGSDQPIAETLGKLVGS